MDKNAISKILNNELSMFGFIENRNNIDSTNKKTNDVKEN